MKRMMIILVLLIFVFGIIGCDNVKQNENSETEGNTAVFETNMGNFEVLLNPDMAPITAANFKDYVNSGFYDGLIFHRVITDFMIQGGGFDKDLNQMQTKEPIKNEADNGLKNTRYTIAMARTSVVDSATSQFFINVNDNSFLDHGERDFGYAVFGKVISGTDVVDKIAGVKTGTEKGMKDVPVEDVVIDKVYLK